ncbi:carbonic anhydrase [Synechococcus sp. M16CYN]
MTLMEGNRRFAKAWRRAADNPATNLGQELQSKRCFNTPQALINEQHPWATLLTCADARVSPDWIFDTTPGELFVIRSAGNTAFDEAIASIEYSISALGCPLVMVMGHSNCGAVATAMSNDVLTPSLERLVTPIRNQIAGSGDLTSAIRSNAFETAATLKKCSALISEAEINGKITLLASCFDLASGAVTLI